MHFHGSGSNAAIPSWRKAPSSPAYDEARRYSVATASERYGSGAVTARSEQPQMWSAASAAAPWDRAHPTSTTATTMAAQQQDMLFYGALSVRVIAENTTASGVAGPVTAGRVDASRGHAVLDVVDAQIFLGGAVAPSALAVRCTMRQTIVARVALSDITEVRRQGNGTAVEIDFAAPEDSAILGGIRVPCRRRHTMVVLAARERGAGGGLEWGAPAPDAACVDELYHALLRAHREVKHANQNFGASSATFAAYHGGGVGASLPYGGGGGGGGGAPTYMTDQSVVDSYAQRNAPRHDGAALTSIATSPPPSSSVSGGFESTGIAAAELELQRIRQRRRQRQQLLVQDLFAVSGAPDAAAATTGVGDDGRLRTAATNAELLFAPRTAAAMRANSGAGSMAFAGDEAVGGMTWCRWCAAFNAAPTHATTCPNRPVQCSWCGARMSHAAFQAHQYTCANVPAAMQRAPSSPPPQSRATAAVAFASPAASPSTAAPAPAVAAPAVEAARSANQAQMEEISDERCCIWCKKPQPKEHDRKCSQRRVVCKACFEEVPIVMKDAHRLKCRKVPSRSSSAVLSSSMSESKSPSLAGSVSSRR